MINDDASMFYKNVKNWRIEFSKAYKWVKEIDSFDNDQILRF